jgi:hypothetical protein
MAWTIEFNSNEITWFYSQDMSIGHGWWKASSSGSLPASLQQAMVTWVLKFYTEHLVNVFKVILLQNDPDTM